MKKYAFLLFAIISLAGMLAISGCKKATYTVTFNPNGGNGILSFQTFTEGKSQALDINTFTREGYSFSGWNTAPSGMGTSYSDGQTITATSDMTLYAQWMSNGSSGGGSTIPGSPIVETYSAEVTGQNAVLSGKVTIIGNNQVTDRGFLYGTSENNLSNRVECGAGTGNFTATITLALYTPCYYKAYATNSIGTSYGEVKQVSGSAAISGSLNGRDYVDLGLPSGIKWATCNVGATTPEGYGNYYAWGETSPKSNYSWTNYQHCNGASNKLTKYCSYSSYGNNGYTDNLTVLESSDDAATVNWGAGWRMPTDDDLYELQSNCTMTWTTQNGVNGCLCTSRSNGNSIFLPAAGYRQDNSLYEEGTYCYLWSSTLDWSSPYRAIQYYFKSGSYYNAVYNIRDEGLPVRAVCQ